MQVASNSRSFSLYTKNGFEVSVLRAQCLLPGCAHACSDGIGHMNQLLFRYHIDSCQHCFDDMFLLALSFSGLDTPTTTEVYACAKIALRKP